MDQHHQGTGEKAVDRKNVVGTFKGLESLALVRETCPMTGPSEKRVIDTGSNKCGIGSLIGTEQIFFGFTMAMVPTAPVDPRLVFQLSHSVYQEIFCRRRLNETIFVRIVSYYDSH